MESTIIVTFSCVAGALLLLSVLTSLVLWARIRGAEDALIDLAQRAPDKKVDAAVSRSELTEARVSNAVVELEKFKSGIHGEVQRLYGIMRRAEHAAGFVKGAQDGKPEEPETPDEIDPSQLTGNETPTKKPTTLSRTELRERARKAGV